MNKKIKIIIVILIIIFIVFISLRMYFSKIAEGDAKYFICSPETYFCSGGRLDITVPCSSDNDCYIERIETYCNEKGPMTIIYPCISCRTYCGNEGYCKSCNCHSFLPQLLGVF